MVLSNSPADFSPEIVDFAVLHIIQEFLVIGIWTLKLFGETIPVFIIDLRELAHIKGLKFV